MTGYQQAILIALGSQLGNRYAVRSIDKYYPDAVQPLFGTTVYSITPKGRDKPQWTVKSSAVSRPSLDEVDDWQGFCRGWIEIHSSLTPITQYRRRNGVRTKTHVPGLLIYGPYDVVETLMFHLPVVPKQIRYLTNTVGGGAYTGTTCELRLQKRETSDVLDYIDGLPRNEVVWKRWTDKIDQINHMD